MMKAQTNFSPRLLLSLACAACLAAPVQAADAGSQETSAKPAAKGKSAKPSRKLDLSGQPRTGKASYYGPGFEGKPMADGTPMNPHADIAASRTLPLGTVAEVVNLENGKSAVVEIRDRGPYVDGRIIDVSTGVAKKLDILEDGVVPVEVRPIELPSGDDEPLTAQR